uniref:Regulator of G-protein signaling 8 n=1 Tax=Neogobius melanostomus TaxID=47308 RepID=A0A8C6T9W1_9GOBI
KVQLERRNGGESLGKLKAGLPLTSRAIPPTSLLWTGTEIVSAYGLVVFRTFLKSEFSDENIEFWMACEDYKKVKGSTKLASKASKIYNEFIDVKAPREINIDYRTRERTKRTLLMEPTPTCLNEVQSKVFSLMEKDSYPRFLRSKMYQDIEFFTGGTKVPKMGWPLDD